ALDDGDTLHYDELVLATGARAAVPPLPGATTSRSRPAEGVTVLRDLADCRRLAALTRPGAPVVVLGGGVLGLETARALGRRGARVHLVEAAAWLMHRQLDQGAARVLAGHYTRLGVTVHSRTAALRWIPGRGLELEDGRVLAGDVLVVATGVRPRTVHAGHELAAGPWRLSVLWPPPDFAGDDPNEGSVVLLARLPSSADAAGLSVLLTGDIEESAQRALLPEPAIRGVDVLKTPHHGAATQEAAFLDATRPRVTLTSVGADNPYGHPAPATWARLTGLTPASYRTDRHGDVAVVPGPDGPVVHWRGPRPR
ncbi:FAD-dependent oxidoreductase, partial [Thermobifida cellulosilytica]